MGNTQASFIAINLVMGLLFIALGIPLAKRKIPMNYWYGFRLPKAFKSPELWYEINAYGGRQMVIWSVPVLVTAIACFLIPVRDDTHPAIVVFLGGGSSTLFVAIAIVKTLIYSSKLAK
ncbi:MAG: SdpI family protein [Candidatus Omnitrophota bacterium]